MPVLPRCPRCQAVLMGTGQYEKCLRCGEVVHAVLRKMCARCNRDISNSPRFRDSAGEYYCQPCWLEICETQGKEPAYRCGECGGMFAGDEVFQEKTQYVCKTCYGTRTGDAAGEAVAVLSALARAEESPEASPMGSVPSLYTESARALRAEKKKRDQMILILSLVGAGVVIIGFTVFFAFFHG